jgi:DNA-binding CsgD family transcriptional regulator
LRLVRGPDSPASLAQLQALLGQASAQHHFASAALRAAAAASAAALGQTDEALAWLETVIDPIERAPAWATNYTALVGMSAWALWFMQRTDHVDVIERNLVSKTLAADFRYPMHDPRHCMARLSALQGRYADASGWFAQARSVTEEQGARPLRAIIDYDEGLMYFRRRRKGDRGRAALLLQAATRQFDAIGMTGWAARADKLQQEILEGSGGQPVLPGALTPREFEVLRLVAQGRTNSEIAAELSLSFRTVGRHITHIFSKLGARNRADATAYATRNGLL